MMNTRSTCGTLVCTSGTAAWSHINLLKERRVEASLVHGSAEQLDTHNRENDHAAAGKEKHDGEVLQRLEDRRGDDVDGGDASKKPDQSKHSKGSKNRKIHENPRGVVGSNLKDSGDNNEEVKIVP